MRLAAPTCLAIAILAAVPGISRAEFRYLSSRLFGGEGGQGTYASNAYTSNGNPALAARSLSIDDSGNVFMIVVSGSPTTFGGAPVGPGTLVVKLRPDGTETWSRLLIISGNPVIAGIAATPDGGAAIAGQLNGTMDFGGGVLTSDGIDAFVVKLDEAGAVAWQRTFGDRFEQEASDVRVATNGDILIIGSNFGSIDFGGGPIRSNGASDVFLARLDAAGGHIWSRGYGQGAAQNGLRLAMGRDGRIALVCYIVAGSIDFGGGPVIPHGRGDIAMASLDANAGHIWTRIIGSDQFETASDIAMDDSNDVFVSGSFSRSLDAGGGIMEDILGASSTGFVASYDPTGAYRWSYMVSDSLRSEARWLGTDHSGNCFLVATKHGALEVPGLTLPESGFFLVAFDSFGAITDTRGFGWPATLANMLMVVTGDEISLAGGTDREVDFGGGPLYPDVIDVFLATLTTRRPAQVAIDGFTARYDDDHVELKWNLTSGEPVRKEFVTRSDAAGSSAEVIYSGAAVDGEKRVIDGKVQPGHTYTYEITVETSLGDPVSDHASITIPVFATSLAQNTPNPFNPITTFPYTLAAPAHVSIAIYDLAGALVARLDQGMQPAGKRQAQWAGHNWEGSLVGSGVYFYRLEGAGDVPSRKMILLK